MPMPWHSFGLIELVITVHNYETYQFLLGFLSNSDIGFSTTGKHLRISGIDIFEWRGTWNYTHSPFKGTVKENERGYRLKSNHFSSWSWPMKVISDVPISRNWYTTCQIYTKINIYTILYKVVGLKRSNSANMQSIWKRWYPRES